MKIKVMSRREIEEFKTDENHIVISISDPNSEKVKITSKPFNILSLQFHDVDKPLVARDKCTACKGTGKLEIFKDINEGHCYRCTDKIDIKLFTDKNAEDILSFVEQYKFEAQMIIIHCEAGISRSAGVAAALSLIYNKSDQYYFDNYLPNTLVYRKILNTYFGKSYEK